MLAKANRDRLAVLLNETELKSAGDERYAAALRCAAVVLNGASAFQEQGCWSIEKYCFLTRLFVAGESHSARTAEAPQRALKASGTRLFASSRNCLNGHESAHQELCRFTQQVLNACQMPLKIEFVHALPLAPPKGQRAIRTFTSCC